MFEILLGLLIALNAADVYTTYRGLTGSTKITEQNGLIQWFIDECGLTIGLILPKFLFFVLVFAFAENDLVWLSTFAVLDVFYVWLVWNNYKVLKRNGISL